MDNKPFAVAIGASAGGVDALLAISAALPRDFPALVFVTQHTGAYRSVLPELMRARGPNDAKHPTDGERPKLGTIYLAPPDWHMLVEPDRIRLYHGPRENHCRPAIDPMFRTVAATFRHCAIGVILTGYLDDGTAGLRAIKDCGGTAIVQDPATASEPSMPQSALDNVEVDLRLHLHEIVPRLMKLVRDPTPQGAPSDAVGVNREERLIYGDETMEKLNEIAQPSGLTCPDCGGGLWELDDQKPLRFRCHTGHAFSALSLADSQRASAEAHLWNGVRALREREMLLRRLAVVSRGNGQHEQARTQEALADRVAEQSDRLERMIEEREQGA
jgi:two-component system, chemotaxis family, protein-glutamate methylesterase/glutaminase